MHNLLSAESKKEVRKEYLWRLFVVALSLLVLLGIILLLSLLPSSILSRSKEKEALGKKETLNESIFALESQNLTSLLQDTKEKLESLKTKGNSLPLHIIIRKVLEHKNQGIEIVGFTASPEKEKVRELSLAGIADSRENLVEFKKSLEQEKTFIVSLPVSNFAKQTDIDFIATLRIQIE